MRAKLLPVLVLSLAWSGPLLAERGEKGKKHKDKGADAGAVSVTFTATQRDEVRGYFARKHGRGNCPPGLAKKNRQCLPPGQLKKRYAVGQPVAEAIEIQPVPHDLVAVLGPPPSGYRFGLVDGDVVQVTVSTRVVVDFIDVVVD